MPPPGVTGGFDLPPRLAQEIGVPQGVRVQDLGPLQGAGFRVGVGQADLGPLPREQVRTAPPWREEPPARNDSARGPGIRPEQAPPGRRRRRLKIPFQTR